MTVSGGDSTAYASVIVLMMLLLLANDAAV
jgi:hypothetical protein